MATIKTSLMIYDGMTGPIHKMYQALNILTGAFEDVQDVSGNAVNTTALQQARDLAAQSAVAWDQVEGNIRGADRAQDDFNDSVRDGASATDGLIGKLKGIAAAIGGAAAIKKIIGLSDELSSTEARLSLMVDDGGSVAALEDKIKASAARSRASFLDTAAAVSKLGLMAGDAFANNDEIIAFTEAVNKQFVIAGATASEQANAMLQLTQAMASGVLRGDELNSIFEQAPNLIQSIADYLGKPIGEIRGLASEGKITADIVKNAMFMAADSIDERFEAIPMTWGQLFTMAGNAALQALQPVLEGLSTAAQFVSDHWATLEPIFIGLAAAAGAYAVALGVQTVATWIATGAAQAFFTTLLANPLFWIALAVGVVVVAIYKWIQAVGGLTNAWNIAKAALVVAWNGIKVGWNSVVYGFTFGLNKVLDFIDRLKLAWQQAGVAIGNYMGDMKVSVLSILQAMVNGAIGIINGFISALNAIPGVNIGLIEQVTFATQAAVENEAAKQARAAGLADYESQLAAAKQGREDNLAAAYGNLQDAISELDASAADLSNMYQAARAGAGSGATDSFDAFNMGTAWDGIFNNTGETASNTAAMKDALDHMDEDLKWMIDIAEREAINRFTTAEISIEMGGVTNNIASEMDIDGVMDALADEILEHLDQYDPTA